MGNAAEISKYINPIRRGAESVCDRPFGADSFLDACLCIDRSGMPDRYGLTATAREFAVFQNGEQLAVTLAGRVGDPRVSPAPPLWPLLAVLLLGWRDTLTAKQIMNRAGDVGAEDHVHRGLAIVAHLFPELQGWLASVPLGIPRWERTVALPLAARKLVFFEEMDQARSADSDVVSSSTPITQTLGPIRWNVTGGTRRGMSHVQSDLKNQDAIRYLVSREAATVVLAVADGHGSDLCFRSDVGSRLAVETAVEVLSGFANTSRCESSYNIRYQDGAARMARPGHYRATSRARIREYHSCRSRDGNIRSEHAVGRWRHPIPRLSRPHSQSHTRKRSSCREIHALIVVAERSCRNADSSSPRRGRFACADTGRDGWLCEVL